MRVIVSFETEHLPRLGFENGKHSIQGRKGRKQEARKLSRRLREEQPNHMDTSDYSSLSCTLGSAHSDSMTIVFYLGR